MRWPAYTRAGRRGAVIRALSAIDIALWDAKAKAAGQPLAVLLGGSTAAQPAYASGGYYRPGDGLPVAEDADRVARDCPLWWFEEPLSPEAIIGHAELDPNPGGGFASSPAPASPSSTPDCRQPGRPGTPWAGRTWPNCA